MTKEAEVRVANEGSFYEPQTFDLENGRHFKTTPREQMIIEALAQ